MQQSQKKKPLMMWKWRKQNKLVYTEQFLLVHFPGLFTSRWSLVVGKMSHLSLDLHAPIVRQVKLEKHLAGDNQ